LLDRLSIGRPGPTAPAAGYHKVKNLEGSIFQWQKQGLPLVSGVGPVEKVHPYDEFWGTLLNPEVVAYHPQNP
jgi:3-mercaptopyruvate sulfurtransferase SseA